MAELTLGQVSLKLPEAWTSIERPTPTIESIQLFLKNLESGLGVALKEYQTSTHNWRNHKLNRDNPFETPLSCGVTNKMLATLFLVAGFEVNLPTVQLDQKTYGVGDHEFILVGSKHAPIIIDGAWKQFFLGSKDPNILVLPSPLLDQDGFLGGIDQLAISISEQQSSKPVIRSVYTGMWGYENDMTLEPHDLSEAIARERLSRPFTTKPISVLTNQNFSQWLQTEIGRNKSSDPLQLIISELKKQGLITVV